MCRQPQVKGQGEWSWYFSIAWFKHSSQHASNNLISVEVDIVAVNACSFTQTMSLTSVIIIIIDIIYKKKKILFID